MTPFEITYPPGATPLDPDEIAGLIPDYITTQAELNELEQKNIQEAVVWAQNRRSSDVLNLGFINELHRRMFGQVWKWAGKARTSGKNIGIEWSQIATQLAQLLADTKYWIEHESFPTDEIAARFHHRLVQIHAFANGNGRHARLMTDLLLGELGHAPFSWGMRTSKSPIETAGVRRQEYIAALQAADRNDYSLLLKFVKS